MLPEAGLLRRSTDRWRLRSKEPTVRSVGVADVTFNDLFDWLADREGERVYVEVGTTDPESKQPADAYLLALHTQLGRIETATDMDRGRDVVLVRLFGGERDRLYFDPQRITRVEIHGGAAKVWFHDAFYVALSGD